MSTLEFANWLQHQLNQRNWGQADLARRAGMSGAGISKIMSGDRKPGVDAIAGIARALNLPADEVMRQAGLLPVPSGTTAEDRNSLKVLIRKIERLSPEDRHYVIELVNRLAPHDEGSD